jgi:hypothetical protein
MLVIAVAALAVAGGVGVWVTRAPSTHPTPSGSAPEPLLRKLCATGMVTHCKKDTVGWCNADEDVIACCDPGLVATGHDGMCDCENDAGCPRPVVQRWHAPGRHPCKAKGSCDAGGEAWCGDDEKELACCDTGMVAVNEDGPCECAPGGSSVDAGCPAATRSRKQWELAFREEFEWSRSQVVECLSRGSTGWVSGELGFAVDVDPDGFVYARIVKGAIPQVLRNRCVMNAVESIRASPPPDGYSHVENLGVSFGRSR